MRATRTAHLTLLGMVTLWVNSANCETQYVVSLSFLLHICP